MGQGRDNYRIALNVAARVGLDNPNFMTEYSRAISALHGLDTLSQLSQNMTSNPQTQGQPTQIPSQTQSQAPTGDLGAGGIQTADQSPTMP